MATYRVLDVGNCGPDHAAIRRTLTEHFDVEVARAHGPTDTLEMLQEDKVDLVLINRKLDQNYSDGIEILRLLKNDDNLASIPVMLVTNYEEHQQAAMAEGAIRGFGKLELSAPTTFERLSAVLS